MIILVISSVIIIPSIPNSYAHAFVTKSDPAPSQSLSSPPTKVDVYFSDPVDIRYREVKVLDSNGKQIQKNDQHYINGDQSTISV
ncbi:MAG: copper resistance protein CopC, partial [Thaumarchaeota archaeon]|nr:copper resistance protein CopC [Nitrososphaerota archaeon]